MWIKLLFNHLSFRLVFSLKDSYPDFIHIVSKDSDFNIIEIIN